MRHLLRKLMFWKRDETVELDFDVEGCFTLPETEAATTESDAEAGAPDEVAGTPTQPS